MSWSVSNTIGALLKRYPDLLNEIFGQGYEIEDDTSESAVVRSGTFTVRFGHDCRDGDTGALIELHDPQTQAESSLWVRFLGEQTKPKLRDATGHVQKSAEQQIEEELRVLVRLQREVFSDEKRARDAAHFVQGYHSAYNDHFAGEW